MEGINCCTFSGNVTRPPELQYTRTNRTPVLNFSIACNERIRHDDGSYHDEPNFLDISVFGNRAESLAKMMQVGTQVFVNAHARRGTWVDKATNQRRTRITFVAENVIIARGTSTNQTEQVPEEVLNEIDTVDSGAFYSDDDE